MALFARGWEAYVAHRRRGVVVIRLVARDARRRRDAVVVIEMATGARRRQVRARQSPARCRVIELAIGPKNRVVALLTGRREAGVRHRGRCIVVVRLVTRDASRNRNVVVVIDVTAGARGC